MHHFFYSGGKLFCEGVALDLLARRFGTPLYVYSEATLSEHFRKLDEAMAPVEHLVCFALKSSIKKRTQKLATVVVAFAKERIAFI